MEVVTILRCCKSKECSFVCCVQCLDVFHRACINRKKSAIFINTHRYICSKQCEDKRSQLAELEQQAGEQLDKLNRQVRDKDALVVSLEEQMEVRVGEFQAEIDRLKTEIYNKDSYIRQQKRRTDDYQDEVLLVEQEYEQKMQEHLKVIGDLNKKISELVLRNRSLLEGAAELEERVLSLERDIGECAGIRANMLTTIETLTKESEFLTNELETIKHNMGVSQTVEQAAVTQCETKRDDDCNLQPRQHVNGKGACGRADYRRGSGSKNFSESKVLILSDETGRGIGENLARNLKGMTVQSIIKPGAGFDSVVEDVTNLVRDYTSKDYVIIAGGWNDFCISGRGPSLKMIGSKIRYCTHTNIIFLSVPVRSKWQSTCCCIDSFNFNLKCYANSLNKYALGRVGYIENNYRGALSRAKRLVCRDVLYFILGGYRVTGDKNLVFVDTVGEVGGKMTMAGDSLADDRANFLDRDQLQEIGGQ